MGQDIYTPFWKEVLIQLKGEFQSGKQVVQFPLPKLQNFGDRKITDYGGFVKYRFGALQGNKDSAPYRDLAAAIKASSAIKPYLNNELEIKVTKDLQLTASYKQISPADLIAAYKKITAKGNDGELYKWTELAKPHFDLDAADFDAMFRSINFYNLIYHNARGVIFHLIRDYTEEVRSAFKVLFNEAVRLEDRIVVFRDTMTQIYRRVEPKFSHHQDERSIATYLTYFKPDNYALFKDAFYLKYCKLIGVTPQEVNMKYVHYLNLLKEFTDKYIRNDKELLDLVAKFKPKDGYADPNYTLLAQDILYQTLEGSWDEDETEKAVNVTTHDKTYTMPALNTILYGPPGTGKTYNTINKAVQIANPSFFEKERTRDDIRKEYERLRTDGQIEFITFHQSMSYEDFVEGIKPKKPVEGDAYLKYDVEEGLFKRMVEKASYQPTPQATVFSLSEDEFSRASFYKISLGNTAIEDDEQIYRYCIDNGYIALGWGDANDFNGLSEHDISTMVPAKLEKFAAQAVNYFVHYLKKDDFVVVSYGNLRFRAIGKVTGDYEYKNVDGLEVKQFRKVQWLLKDVDIPVEELYNKQFSQQSIYKLNRSEIKKEFFVKGQVSKIDSIQKKNYVLIIDEINRGNVSQIFGELITLIEEDKRTGKDEALTVTLPYSKKPFSVPDNLYIIGTMNTADRSVEALDTALRRRFVFEAMLPKEELLRTDRMLWSFLWKHKDDRWIDDRFKEKEKKTYPFFGLGSDYEDKKHDMWENWEKEGEREKQIAELSAFDYSGIDLSRMLKAINERLEALLSKDHTIGHAWLMDVYSLDELQNAFKNKILPLLQEYFYNNYAKLGLVLGERFFTKQDKVDKKLFARFGNGAEIADDYSEKVIYALKPAVELSLDDFKSIYQ